MLTDTWIASAKSYGQEHLLDALHSLSGSDKELFETQLIKLDFAELDRLYQKSREKECSLDFNKLNAPAIVRLPHSDEEHKEYLTKTELGEESIRRGEVAVILVAGGQGTRLGHNGPKGTYPIGPASNRSLFQIHTEKVLALSRRYKCQIPLLIMTSQENDSATKAFFTEHHGFGIHREHIHFFTQGMLPALDAASGRVLLKSPHELALSPNGHGGVVEALQEAGLLSLLEEIGIKHCFYFQVDNPLVKVADPAFLGYHLAANSEMSLKVLAKLSPQERMGNLVEYDGRHRIIEYTELPKEIAEETTEGGELRIWAGSPAIHFFSLSFLQKLGTGEIKLPYHIAHKSVTYFENGSVHTPDRPNALKFERFVFDALPLAEKTLAMETTRREEFEPLKNAEGENSPETVRQAMTYQYLQWLSAAGIKLPFGKLLEISPLVAMDASDLKSQSLLKGLEQADK
ncbi:MAG TPA: UDPGP type 1 family protein [Gemmatales bacterium]|nr:UDPGP type 1 family protein [Gemmatales bacterium]HMP16938.1 UDPGP type 1 family protein [Gemmatales bacterium]